MHSGDDAPDLSELEVRRQSLVRLQLEVFDKYNERFVLDLFSDVSILVEKQGDTKVDTRVDGTTTTWFGKVQGVSDSAVRIVVIRTNGKPVEVAAFVSAPLGLFRVRRVPDGSYLAQELIMAGEGTETNRFTLIPFLEGTDVFWTVKGGASFEERIPNKLEANIFPHLVVAQNYADVLNIDRQERRDVSALREFAYAFSGTPAVRIRMLRLQSAPVRTPSYMPRGNFQFLWVRGLKDCDPSDPQPHCSDVRVRSAQAKAAAGPERVRLALSALPRVTVWEAHAIIGHHSNGQDGCISSLESRDPAADNECRPITALTRETINYRDGSFSTNYYRVGVNWSRHRLVGPEAKHETRIMAEFEHHPAAWVDERIVDLYGRRRANFLGSYARKDAKLCQKRIEVLGALTWNWSVTDGVPEASWTGQLSCFPTTNGGWGFFLRYYNGQDYYNVGFLDSIRRVHVGMTFNQAGFFRFRRSPTVRQ